MSANRSDLITLSLSNHARERMDARSISASSIAHAFEYGRIIFANKARIYFIGRKEVRRMAKNGIDISRDEGIHVVTTCEGVVLTTYRNRSIRHLRPKRHVKRRFH